MLDTRPFGRKSAQNQACDQDSSITTVRIEPARSLDDGSIKLSNGSPDTWELIGTIKVMVVIKSGQEQKTKK